ncbi:MAG: DUF956 family protein [Streptococcaceae bacterium]|jgi:hypothetical protein|nr:DUF956 family protein [Streptococcaceae bacterium]
MVQSLNTKVELVVKGTSFLGGADYGKILLGDKGFEFYDDRKVENFIQIPWEEVDVVLASLLFKGKWIPRFSVRTKKNGQYSFSSKTPKEVLKVCEAHIGRENVRASLSAAQVSKRAFKIYGELGVNVGKKLIDKVKKLRK